MEDGIGKCLDKPVLYKFGTDSNHPDNHQKNELLKSKPGHLQSNFDRNLEKLL